MAQVVTIRARLQRLKEADQVIRRVIAKVKESANLTREQIRERVRGLNEQRADIRQQRQVEQQRGRLQNRANSLRGRAQVGDRAAQAAERGFDRADSVLNRATSFGNAFRSGGSVGLTVGVLNLSSALGGGLTAALLGLVAGVAEELKEFVDKRIQEQDERVNAALRSEIGRALREADVERRLREDPVFAREQSQQALDAYLGEQQAMARIGIVEGSPWSGVDF